MRREKALQLCEPAELFELLLYATREPGIQLSQFVRLRLHDVVQALDAQKGFYPGDQSSIAL